MECVSAVFKMLAMGNDRHPDIGWQQDSDAIKCCWYAPIGTQEWRTLDVPVHCAVD